MNEEIMSRPKTAEFLDVTVGTMATWAYRGTGPRYYRVGKHVRYRKADVLAWLEENAREPRSHRVAAAP